MSKTLIFDLPTRLFHWSFAGFFAISYIITNVADDESSVFPYHALSGICLVSILILRLIWGIVGTKYAKFSSYKLNPADLMAYLKAIITGQSKRSLGRNPASSWAAITMMLMALGLGLTGYLMASGSGSRNIKEIHELLANGFFIVVLLHIAGVVLHTLRHKDPIAVSMITGRKERTETDTQGITNPKEGIGVAFIFMLLMLMAFLGLTYNSQHHSLNIFGTQLQLGEIDDEKGFENKENEEDDDD